jgi:carbonic anhydrase
VGAAQAKEVAPVPIWRPRLAAQHAAIVTSKDTRVDLHRVARVRPGATVVIRNAGGRAADALRSLVIAYHELEVREVVVMHHTDCRLLAFSEASLWQKIRFATGADADVPFLPFSNLAQSLQEDVELIRASPLFGAGLSVRGFIYDLRQGRLHEVDVPVRPWT